MPYASDLTISNGRRVQSCPLVSLADRDAQVL
jgi:hypothetical protein